MQVTFPSDWNFGESFESIKYQTERSISNSFENPEILQPQDPVQSGRVYVVFDAWNGTDLYYRVTVIAKNITLAVTNPSKPIDQNKSVFVTPGVDSGQTTDCGRYLSSPCTSLKRGIERAQDGDTIYATPGVYIGEDNVNLSMRGKEVKLTSTNGPALSLINCTNPITLTQTLAFVIDDADFNVIVDGFTIVDGSSDAGGCMKIQDASPTISNMAFINCKALSREARGGAVYVSGPLSRPKIHSSLFYYTQANEGGAIYIDGGAFLEILSSSIELGICPSGTGLGGGIYALNSKLKMVDSEVKNCISGFAGGGIMLDASDGFVQNIVVKNNTVANTGGGINLFGSNMTAVGMKLEEVRFHMLHDRILIVKI